MASKSRMTISHMKARDIPNLVSIDHLVYESNGWNDDSFRAHFKSQSLVGIVARDAGVPFACISGIIQRSGIYIARLVVHPERRKEGVGSALFEALHYQLRTMNKPFYYLLSDIPEAGDWFSIGQDFLRKNGFSLQRVVRNIERATCQKGEQTDRLKSVYHFVHAVTTA